MVWRRATTSRHLRRTFSSSIRIETPPAPASPTPAAAAALGDILVVAALSKSFSAVDASLLPSPLPEHAVLQLLGLPSLTASAKLSFFRWATNGDGKGGAARYSPSPAAFSALICSLARSRPPLLDPVRPLLRRTLSLPSSPSSSLVPTAFRAALDAFLQAGRFDLAIAALDDADRLGSPGLSLLTPAAYSSVLLALLRRSEISLALTLFRKLLRASGVSPDALPCATLLAALRRAGRKDDFRSLFDELSQSGLLFDARCYNVCIHAFGSWGQLGLALALFGDMKSSAPQVVPDLCTYNSVLGALCRAGRLADAMQVYEELKGSGYEPDAFTYRTLINGCCKVYRIDEAIRVFNEMEYNNVPADTVVYNTLLDGLLKARKLVDACQLFEKMISQGVRASCYSYNILIDGLFKNGRQAAGFALFTDLKKKGHFVDCITYSIVIQHLCKESLVAEALDLVKEMEDRGFSVDLITITSLLIALHKCGRWDSAEQLMKYIRDSTTLTDIIRWKENMETSMRGPQDTTKDYISMFPSVGSLADVLNWVVDPSSSKDASNESSDTEPKDNWSLTPYLDNLTSNFNKSISDDSLKLTVSRGRRVIEKGMNSFDVNMVNTYLSIFVANGKLSVACKLFEIFTSMGRETMSYTYNSLLSSFVKKGYLSEAWGILQEMEGKLCPADVATYNMIIQGLGKMGKAELASAVLDQLLKKGGYLDVVMYNTLIDALGKGGRLDEANKLFKQMVTSGINPDVITFNTLIEVHAKAGKVQEAYKFLRKMLTAGCSPNHVTDTILDFLDKEIEKSRYQKASMTSIRHGKNEDTNGS